VSSGKIKGALDETLNAYHVSVNGSTITSCPVDGCPYRIHRPEGMRLHFQTMHNKDTIVIKEEGVLPQCLNCGIFQSSVGLAHQKSKEYQRWSKVLKERDEYETNMKVVCRTSIKNVLNTSQDNILEVWKF
jgi:hypothetical protein